MQTWSKGRVECEMVQSLPNKILFSVKNVRSGQFSSNHSYIGRYANEVLQPAFEVPHFSLQQALFG